MTLKEAKALATKIAKESNGVRVIHGITNGKHCLHLARKRNDEKHILSDSRTIFSAAEWDQHEFNFYVKRISADEDHITEGVADAIANREAI